MSIVIYEKSSPQNTFLGWKPRVLDWQSLEKYLHSSLDDACAVVAQMHCMFNAEAAGPEESYRADLHTWEMLLASLSELPDIRFEAPDIRFAIPLQNQLEEVLAIVQSKHATVKTAETSALLLEVCKELKTKIDEIIEIKGQVDWTLKDFRWKECLVYAAREQPIPPAPEFTGEGVDMQVLKEWACFFPTNQPCAAMAVSHGLRMRHVPCSMKFSMKLDDPPCYIEGIVRYCTPAEPFYIYTHEVYPSKHKSDACKVICSKLAGSLGSFDDLYNKPQDDFFVTPTSVQIKNKLI